MGERWGGGGDDAVGFVLFRGHLRLDRVSTLPDKCRLKSADNREKIGDSVAVFQASGGKKWNKREFFSRTSGKSSTENRTWKVRFNLITNHSNCQQVRPT